MNCFGRGCQVLDYQFPPTTEGLEQAKEQALALAIPVVVIEEIE